MKRTGDNQLILWRLFDVGWLSIGGIIVIITRWLYHSQYLFHWDSVQFALALHGIDVAIHRPHPPGYLFYVYLVQVVKLFSKDDNLALVGLSIIASIAGLVLVYYLAITIFRQRLAGIIASLLFIFSATVAFHGMIGEVYMVESVAALVVIALLYHYWQKPSFRSLIWAVIALGLLGGIRQFTELALLPLLLYVLIYHRRPLKEWLVTAGLLVITNLLWLIPLAILSGGLLRYLGSFQPLYQVVLLDKITQLGSWWGKIIDNLSVITQTVTATYAWELIVGYIVLSPWLITHQLKRQTQVNWARVIFWVLAVTGSLVLIALTLMTNPGYLLMVELLLLIWLGGGLALLYDQFANRINRPVAVMVVSFLTGALITHQIFLFYTLKPEEVTFASPARQSIAVHDELIKGLIDGITKTGQSDQTAIWIDSPQTMLFFDIRHLQYYLPSYDIYRRAPDSIKHSATTTIWHANGLTDEFISQVELKPEITKLFIIRPFWNELHELDQIPLQISANRYIVYYDLTQPEVRADVAQKFGFKVW